MNKYSGDERRKHPRAYRPLVISYKRADRPSEKAQIAQVRNISQGGFAFSCDEEFTPGEILDLYIRIPLAKEAIKVQGKVLDSCRVSSNLFCETRVIFTEISVTASKQIGMAVKFIKQEMRK